MPSSLSGPPAHICSLCDRTISEWLYTSEEEANQLNANIEKHNLEEKMGPAWVEVKAGWEPWVFFTGCLREGCPKMDDTYKNTNPLPPPDQSFNKSK